ncbi:MAG: hypothetical protein ABIH38_05805 [Patescibacteria group bacterium]
MSKKKLVLLFISTNLPLLFSVYMFIWSGIVGSGGTSDLNVGYIIAGFLFIVAFILFLVQLLVYLFLLYNREHTRKRILIFILISIFTPIIIFIAYFNYRLILLWQLFGFSR